MGEEIYYLGIVLIGCFLSGFFMLRYSLKLKEKLRQKKEDCSTATKGTIIRVIRKHTHTRDHTHNHSNTRNMYYHVYEYMAHGEKITAKSEYGIYTAYPVGTQVELYYNPHNPTEFYVPADKADSTRTTLFLGGLLFLFMAVLIAVIICLDYLSIISFTTYQ